MGAGNGHSGARPGQERTDAHEWIAGNMGCCSSVPVAPDNIIPDPGDAEQCTFTLKSAGMLSSDYLAYKGESADDDQARWFFVNKTGTFWGGDAIVEIENFVRGNNEEKPNQGEILWTAKFNDKPQFQQHLKEKSSPFSMFVPSFLSKGGVQDAEPEDRVYFEKAGYRFRDGGPWAIIKWSLETSAEILPGKRGQVYGAEGFELKVFARGTAICDYDKEVDDGRTTWKKNIKEFVDMLCFQIVQKSTGETIATWTVPGDLEAASDVVQKNPVFDLEMVGGWLSKKPVIRTAENWDPVFALAV